MTNNDSLREFIANTLANVAQDTMVNPQIIFLKQEYDIAILNKNGDAKITVTNHVINSSAELVRNIGYVFVCETESESEALELKAYSNENELEIEVVKDDPKEKHISILLENPIESMQHLTVNYQYSWERMFPRKEEYYVLYVARPCNNLRFMLSYFEPVGYEIYDFKIHKHSRLFGENEQLPLVPEIFKQDEEAKKITVEFPPDIFCQYRYSWTRN